MIKAKKTAAQAARNFILQVTVKIEELCLVSGGHWRSLEVTGGPWPPPWPLLLPAPSKDEGLSAPFISVFLGDLA